MSPLCHPMLSPCHPQTSKSHLKVMRPPISANQNTENSPISHLLQHFLRLHPKMFPILEQSCLQQLSKNRIQETGMYLSHLVTNFFKGGIVTIVGKLRQIWPSYIDSNLCNGFTSTCDSFRLCFCDMERGLEWFINVFSTKLIASMLNWSGRYSG